VNLYKLKKGRYLAPIMGALGAIATNIFGIEIDKEIWGFVALMVLYLVAEDTYEDSINRKEQMMKVKEDFFKE